MKDFSVTEFNSQQHLVQETIKQINKDFDGYECEIQINEMTIAGYDRLLKLLENCLRQIAKKSNINLYALLYRIDIPEKIFSKITDSQTDYYENLADAIIRREYFKVVTRIKFSQKN